jgi:hypothetical protein
MKEGKVIERSYGSIPHLSTSKMSQQADKKINIDQEYILTKKARDWKDLIILTEKVDGSNVGVIKKDGYIIPIGRSGYTTESSEYKQHKMFDEYVFKNIHLFNWIPEGFRICGEWCIQSHGTIYDITNESPFVAFDIIDQNNKRITFFEFYGICKKYDIPMVPILHIGQPISISNAVKLLGKGHYGNPEKPEGCVYRVERDNKVDFLAKWVRSDKEDGKYLDNELYNIGYNDRVFSYDVYIDGETKHITLSYICEDKSDFLELKRLLAMANKTTTNHIALNYKEK